MKEKKEEKNNNDKNQENMDNNNNNNNYFDRDDIFISIGKDNIIKYCRKCHCYIIILKNIKKQTYQCLYCEENGKLQNIFVDDAKIYFNDKKSVTNNKIINNNNNGNPIYQITKYSSSCITLPNG